MPSDARRAREERWEAYRRKVLPGQLQRARRRVQHLEREALRLGMTYLLLSNTGD